MARVTVSNRPGADGRPVQVGAGPERSILNALLSEGVAIRHDCGGKAQCGTCAFRALSGGSGLSPLGEREAARLAAGDRPPGSRLACQVHAARDLEIELLDV